MVVTQDGTVRCYDLQGEFTQFSLGNGAEEFGVASCRLVVTISNASSLALWLTSN